MLQRACAVLILGWYWGHQWVAAGNQHAIEPLTMAERLQYGIPVSAEILLNSKTTCELPPLNVRAELALGCRAMEEGRKCTESAPYQSVFTTSPSNSCHGKKCRMGLTPDTTACMLDAFGVDVQKWNETRKPTCGLDPARSYWLGNFRPKFDVRNETNCLTGLRKEISLEYWTPCVNGAPKLQTLLTFAEPFPGNYSCFFAPECHKGGFKSVTICYSVEDQDDDELLSLPDAEGEAAPQHIFFVLVFPLILMFLGV